MIAQSHSPTQESSIVDLCLPPTHLVGQADPAEATRRSKQSACATTTSTLNFDKKPISRLQFYSGPRQWTNGLSKHRSVRQQFSAKIRHWQWKRHASSSVLHHSATSVPHQSPSFMCSERANRPGKTGDPFGNIRLGGISETQSQFVVRCSPRRIVRVAERPRHIQHVFKKRRLEKL